MKKIILLTLFLPIFLCLSACSHSKVTKKPSAKSNANQIKLTNFNINKTHEYVLNNGLRLLVTPDKRAPVVIAQVWYKIGAIYEPKGLTGISHMLEHMMFKGTAKFKPGEIEEIVLNNGGKQNAFTNHDYTAYYQYWGNDQLEKSFEIESERMTNLKLDQALFDKEKQVVMEERRMRVEDNPQSYAYEQLIDLANKPNPNHHPVIGWMSDIKAYQLADLADWYRNYYAPNNATIVIVGDVNPNEVYRLVKKYFNHIPPSKHIPKQPKQKNLTNSGYKHLNVYRKNVSIPTLLMAYNVPSIITAKQSWEPYALIVLDSIIADNNSSRLRKNLTRDKQITTHISSGYNPFSISPTLLTIIALPNHGIDTQQLEQTIIQELNKIKHNGITQKELKRIQQNVIASKIYSLDSIPSQANILGTFISIGLDKDMTRNYLNKILAVTPKQVSKVAQKYINNKNLTVITLLPEIKESKSTDNYNQIGK